MKDSPLHHITRFTYEFTSFLGWRVTLCRNHVHFTRYFSDRQYGGEEASLAAAIKVRDYLLEQLSLFPDDPAAVFRQCMEMGSPALYPAGMTPVRVKKEEPVL